MNDELVPGDIVLVPMKAKRMSNGEITLWAFDNDGKNYHDRENFLYFVPTHDLQWTRQVEPTEAPAPAYWIAPGVKERADAVARAANYLRPGMTGHRAEEVVRAAHYIVSGDLEEALADYTGLEEEDED